MSEYDLNASDGWLQETYTKKDYFRPFQENYTNLLNDINVCPDEPVMGRRWNVPLYIATPFNVTTGPEGGPQPDVVADSEIQGQVLACEFKGSLRLTELLERQGASGTHFNGGALNHKMKQATSDLTKLMQIMYWQHGSGRVGIVDQTEVGVNVIKMRVGSNAPSILRVRKNGRYSIYNADSAGTEVHANLKITLIDRVTKGDPGGVGYNTYAGTITVNGSPITVTAGHGIYLKGTYGYAPNGIDGLIGSETIAPTFLTKSRATYPELNTNRLHASGIPRDLTEDLMRQMADLIYFNGTEIDQIRTNAGGINAYAKLQSNDKRYSVVNGNSPKYILGHNEGDLLFAYDKVTAVIKKDPQCCPRTFKFLSLRDSFYKHTTEELGFLNRGGGVLLPVVSASGGGYDYAITARLYAVQNISCYDPLANGSLEDVKDFTLAGDV
jgi:hypothetical protein